MAGSFHVAEEYRRILTQFAGSLAPGQLPATEPAKAGDYDPLRPLPLGQVAPIIDRLRAVPSEVPLEWRLGECLGANAIDMVTARALGSRNIGDALVVGHRHQHIQSNVRSFSLRQGAGGDVTEFHHVAEGDPELLFVFHSLFAAKIWLLFHFYRGPEALKPIDFRAKCFGSLLHRFARGLDFIDIQFRSAEIMLNLSRNVLMQGLPDMGERQRRACDQELQRRSAETHSAKRWADRIKNQIRLSNFDEASIGDICDAFRVPKRTLGRLLRDEGTNFTSILTELRRERALHLVRNTAVPLKRVAAELGYNSDASFSMAFKSWTGTTPAKFRKTATVMAPANDQDPLSANILFSKEKNGGRGKD